MDLTDLKVVDLTRLLPGPYATQLLADMGADVVKVEDTGAGDMARYVDPIVEGVGGMFASVNRGKRSISIDLKSDGGREAFLDVAEDADAVVEGFRPGVADRLGVDYDSVRERNPSVVYVSLSGYGQTGPRCDAVGHDLNYVGYAGLLDMTRDDDDEPVIPGYPIADMSGGLMAANAVVSGVLSRELGGGDGEYLDVSMTDVVASLGQAVTPEAAAGEEPEAGETQLTGGLACYDVYRCSDGEYLTLGALEPKFWRAWCEAVDRSDLVDRHLEGSGELTEEVAGVFREKTAEEWMEEVDTTEVPVGRVQTPGEMLEDARERGVVRESAVDAVGLPVVAELPEHSEEAPARGEHTTEVLLEVGYSESEVEELRESGDVA